MEDTEPASSPLRHHSAERVRPRKRLGQNFLRDRSYLRRIVDAIDIRPGDEVAEVGAGTGVLTGALAERASKLIAIELDDHLQDVLRRRFAPMANVTIWHGNALSFDPGEFFGGPYKLAGNIPYYITGPILRHFLEIACPPTLIVLMVQREVAERMVARPGHLSLLGVSVQYYSHPEIIARVPANAFFPRPKVESAIVRLTPLLHRPAPEEREGFFDVARAGFSVRRKQLVNALSNGLGISRAEAQLMTELAGIDATRRAETLSLDEWHRLATAWRTRSEGTR